MPTTPTRLADALREIERLRAENEALRQERDYYRRDNDKLNDAIAKEHGENVNLCAENEALRQDAERWLLIRLSNKTRVQAVRDGAWHTLFYGGHGDAESVVDALRGAEEK